MTLYEKHVSDKGRISYRQWTPPDIPAQVTELTGEQIITLGVSASVTALELLHRHLKPHQLTARKIRACEQAIYDLARGTGAPVDGKIIDEWITTWNTVTLQMQAGGSSEADAAGD